VLGSRPSCNLRSYGTPLVPQRVQTPGDAIDAKLKFSNSRVQFLIDIAYVSISEASIVYM